jgi:hypothetical protein
MRVLIRKRTSSKFLADCEHWVADRQNALDFASSVMALNVAHRMSLEQVEIVLDFGKPGSDIVLNVPDDSKNPPRLR